MSGAAASSRADLRRFAWLSIAASLVTIALKVAAWRLTGSVGLFSDALEGLVNLAAAVLVLVTLTVAARPPDDDHAYGHDKAEYFAAGIEGALVLLAALSIVAAAVPRLLHPAPIAQAPLGLALSALASGVNLSVALVLRRAGRRHRSPTLVADAHHLLTDVYSSAAVIAGVAVVAATGWTRLDPLLAFLVGGVIVRTGLRLLHGAAHGLMDRAFDAAETAAIGGVLGRHRAAGLDFHALRTRQAGTRRFLSVHVLVPPDWTVQRAHDEVEHIEADLRAAVPGLSVLTHLEPLGDPAAHDDIDLDR